MGFKRWIARLYDLPNAYRVLDIMDHAGCDIVAPKNAEGFDLWMIRPKWYVSMSEANDIRDITLHKAHYRKRGKIASFLFYRVFFPTFREGTRIPDSWLKER